MMDTIEELESNMKRLYNDIRQKTTPNQEIRRKVDACIAVTVDLLGLMRTRLVEDEFDAELEKSKIRLLLNRDYARSIYGSTTTELSNHPSESSSISAKRAEAAAELAAKRAEINMEAVIDAHRQELKRLEKQKEVEVIEARLRVYSEEEARERNVKHTPLCDENNPFIGNEEGRNVKGEASLVQTLQEAMALTRLPTPEPTVFFGDPLKFIEWSTSFKALVERRCSDPADKLFYRQRYIDGEARSTLEGSFYRKDEEAYQQAWDKLNARYGHPFIIHRSFREKLNRWPRIGAHDYIKLREYGDFLQNCSNAMPHIKGLQILNDCEENQRMLRKLPDWITSRWNRHVTEQLDEAKDYPSFQEFASFIAKEARIACNPISSLLALKPIEGKPPVKYPKANTLTTDMYDSDVLNTSAKSEEDEIVSRNLTKKNIWSHNKCICCGNDHSLCECPKLREKSKEEKKRFVMDNRLCFGCLRGGHISREC